MIYSYKNIAPEIPDSVFIAENATIIGDVKIGEDASVWFNVVMRGDVNNILIGAQTNIQDGSILHVNYPKWPLKIGNGVTVGHGAIVHGCVVEDSCLIGMGARVLDGARVGKHSLVAAGSLVREGSAVPSGTLAAGVPAVVKRNLTGAEIEQIKESADRYVAYKNSYLNGDLKQRQ